MNDGATKQIPAEFSRLYAQAAPEDQLALGVWMRDILLRCKVGSVNTERARRKRLSLSRVERTVEGPWESSHNDSGVSQALEFLARR